MNGEIIGALMEGLDRLDPGHHEVRACNEELIEATSGRLAIVQLVALVSRLAGVLSTLEPGARDDLIGCVPEMLDLAARNIAAMRRARLS